MAASIFTMVILMCWSATNGVPLYRYDSPPEKTLYDENGDRTRGFKDVSGKDFIIGGLFAVHRPAAGSASGRCSNELIRSGAERTEAFLYSLDLINNDPEILSGISLGYDIRDTCVSENIALDEIVELSFNNENAAATVDNTCSDSISSSSGFSGSDENDDTNTTVTSGGPMSVVSVVGPTTSQVSLSVASFMRLFTTPGVSYSVSSPTFNNRDRYGYFYRTHSSDRQEVQAIVDLLLHFSWTYVTAIHSNNAYGEPGIDAFRQLAEANQICVDLDIGLDDHLNTEQYYSIASQVITKSEASVILFFASLEYVELFMKQFAIIQRANKTRSFLWVASSSWAQASTIQLNYPDIITGLWGFEFFTNAQSNYNDYASQLTLDSNKRSPWFRDYYEEYFQCRENNYTCNNSLPITDAPNYTQRNYIQLVIDAVYSVAHALNNFLLDSCAKPLLWDRATQTCAGQSKQLNGSALRDYLQNVSFTSPSGNNVTFDSSGNVQGQYRIVNFQLNNGVHEFVKVGMWREYGQQQILTLFNNVNLQFGVNLTDERPLSRFVSQCNQCNSGEIKVIVQSSCCGTCRPCYGQEFANLTTDTQCSTCPNGTWGNNPLQGSDNCVEIAESYLNPTDGFGILLIVVGIIGLISVTLVSIAMGIYWKTPVIKSSGREQMTLLLIGIGLSFLVTVFFIVRPSIGICLLQRVCTWFCFTLILSALFIKLLRIARIFMRNHMSKRPRFIQSKYQVLFTFLLVSVQMVLVIISLIVVYPEATESVSLNGQNTLNTPTLNIQCATPHIAVLCVQILTYSLLLVATNILAVMTIRFPDNFNEARYVACATFSILLIWVAFLQTYFAVDSSYQIAIVCFAIQLTSLSVLVCLFVPRIFLLVASCLPSKEASAGDLNNSSGSPFGTNISRSSALKWNKRKSQDGVFTKSKPSGETNGKITESSAV